MKKKLVIFDLDGTLLNTIADIATATNYALRTLGYPTHNEESIRSFVGNGIRKLLERALPEDKRCEGLITELYVHFTEYYDRHNTDLSTPYHGVMDLMRHLQQKGIKLAVASNKYQSATEKLVTHYFPNIHFEYVLGQRPNIPVKPNPQIVKDIQLGTNTDKKDILYVGDSGVDMQTAINAEVDAIAVSWGFRSREELESYKPLAIIDDPMDIEKWVL